MVEGYILYELFEHIKQIDETLGIVVWKDQ